MMKRINLRLVIVLAGLLVVGGSAALATHACQFGRESAALLAEADRAEKAGNLPRAADYLRRRLTYTPADLDIQDRYGRILDRLARTTGERERALALFEDILARAPDRHDLRARAVDLATQLGRYDLARDMLAMQAHYRPADGEVQDLIGQCWEAQGDADKAAAAYQTAVTLAPGRALAYLRLARLLRGVLGRPSDADQVMDDLVAANDESFTAHLARAAYFAAKGSLDGAEKDAARARELAPDDASVLLTTADIAARRGRTEDARGVLHHALELHSDDMALRLGLARLELKTGRPKEAAQCLEDGRRALAARKGAPGSSELLNLLVEARLQQGDTQAVESLVAEARKGGAAGEAEYFAARALMHDGRWSEAARLMEDQAKTSVLSLDQGVRTLLCLAECYGRLSDADRRLGALNEAVRLSPASAPARVALGAALLDSGHTDEALDLLRRTTQQPQASEEVWTLLARALVLHDQGLPENRPDWSEVDRALDHCAPSAETARLRAAALRARGRDEQATALLEQARDVNSDQPPAWIALALDAARHGDVGKASKILDAAGRRLGDRVELRLAQIDAWTMSESGPPLKSLSDLEKGTDAYSAHDRARLLGRLAETYYRIGDATNGDRLCRLVAAEPATDLSARLPLLTAVLSSTDESLVKMVLADVGRLEGEGGAWQEYGRAAYLVARARRGDGAGLDEAKTLLDDLSRRRPDWPRVALLQGRLAELQGDAAGELDAYRRAFNLGEHGPDVARVLITMLTARGRWDDTDQALRRLQEDMPLRGAWARQAAEIALRTHNNERAVEMARRAAPDPDDYAYHVWLGRVLSASGQLTEAEEELRRAVHFPGAGWDATAALAAHLAGQGRRDDARAAVDELKATLPPRYAAVPLASCYEAAGRLDLAAQYFDEALAKRSDDGPTLTRVAAFDLRLDRPAHAETVLRRLLDSGNDVSPADLSWARRELAMTLAASGDDGKAAEASALLAGGPRPGEDRAAFRRAQAFVQGLTSRERKGADDALRSLEAKRQAAPLPADEEFWLARLYDAAGRWRDARGALVGLLTVDKQNPEYLAWLIDGLLRHDEPEEAGPWTARLDALEPGSERVKQFRARTATALSAPARPQGSAR